MLIPLWLAVMNYTEMEAKVRRAFRALPARPVPIANRIC